MRLPDKLYDVLKWVTLIVLPAIGILYKTLASIWGLPYAEQISMTTQALALFIGALIGISSVQYYKNK